MRGRSQGIWLTLIDKHAPYSRCWLKLCSHCFWATRKVTRSFLCCQINWELGHINRQTTYYLRWKNLFKYDKYIVYRCSRDIWNEKRQCSVYLGTFIQSTIECVLTFLIVSTHSDRRLVTSTITNNLLFQLGKIGTHKQSAFPIA